MGNEILALIRRVSAGVAPGPEELGHQEFVLAYKTFEPIGPACLTGRQSRFRSQGFTAPAPACSSRNSRFAVIPPEKVTL
jgi:hypothetical protein